MNSAMKEIVDVEVKRYLEKVKAYVDKTVATLIESATNEYMSNALEKRESTFATGSTCSWGNCTRPPISLRRCDLHFHKVGKVICLVCMENVYKTHESCCNGRQVEIVTSDSVDGCAPKTMQLELSDSASPTSSL